MAGPFVRRVIGVIPAAGGVGLRVRGDARSGGGDILIVLKYPEDVRIPVNLKPPGKIRKIIRRSIASDMDIHGAHRDWTIPVKPRLNRGIVDINCRPINRPGIIFAKVTRTGNSVRNLNPRWVCRATGIRVKHYRDGHRETPASAVGDAGKGVARGVFDSAEGNQHVILLVRRQNTGRVNNQLRGAKRQLRGRSHVIGFYQRAIHLMQFDIAAAGHDRLVESRHEVRVGHHVGSIVRWEETYHDGRRRVTDGGNHIVQVIAVDLQYSRLVPRESGESAKREATGVSNAATKANQMVGAIIPKSRGQVKHQGPRAAVEGQRIADNDGSRAGVARQGSHVDSARAVESKTGDGEVATRAVAGGDRTPGGHRNRRINQSSSVQSGSAVDGDRTDERAIHLQDAAVDDRGASVGIYAVENERAVARLDQ